MDREYLVNESILQYYGRWIGAFNSLAILLLAVLSFVLVAMVVFKGKGPTIGPALLLTAPMAAYYGLFATIGALNAPTRVIEQSGTVPDLAELFVVIGSSLNAFYLGMLVSMPTFLLGAIGAVTRSLRQQETR